jgi:hypothetical protein
MDAWAGVLAHEYLGYLASVMHAWERNSAFDLVTSAAVGSAVFLLTRWILNQPEPRIPPACVPYRLPRVGFRTLGMLAVISTLVQVEQALKHLTPPPPTTEVSDAEPFFEPAPDARELRSSRTASHLDRGAF